MSLKRKASYPNLSSPGPIPSVSVSISATLDENPKHLHSRTRKRFRNDRPSDETVYEKTLRWLFTAQRQQGQQQPPQDAIIPTIDDEMDPESSTPVPEVVDPRQQSLFRFFRRTQPSRSRSQSPSLEEQADSSTQLSGYASQSNATSGTDIYVKQAVGGNFAAHLAMDCHRTAVQKPKTWAEVSGGCEIRCQTG